MSSQHPSRRLAETKGLGHGQKRPMLLSCGSTVLRGAGKSAIAQTFAEMCDEFGLLLGSFFFGRSDSMRNHAGHLIPTLAYQIAIKLPEYRANLESAIDRDPLIFSKSIETQLMALIIEPLRPLITSGLFEDPEIAPRLIIIDGLDECQGAKIQSALIDLIAKLLRTQSVPLIFLIASRPDPAISYRFNSTMLAEFLPRLPLDDEELRADDDIRRFLEDEFAQIKTDHPRKRSIPLSWPPTDAIETLIKKASGQFIFGAVAMKYISSIDDLPTRALETVLGLRPPRRDMPFAELNALYLHILESARYKDEALRVIVSVLLRTNFDCTIFVEFVLHLETGDTEVFLADLAALVFISSEHIRIKHASFSDFLFDPARSQSLYVNPGQYHTKFAIEWLQSHVTSQSQEFISLLEKNPSFSQQSQASMLLHNHRYGELQRQFPLAYPTPELREAILQCSLQVMLIETDVAYPHHGNQDRSMGSLESLDFLLNYVEAIRKLELEDIQEIYGNCVHQLDNIFIKYFDVMYDNNITYTFLDGALMLSKYELGDDMEEIKNTAMYLQRVKEEPLSCVAKRIGNYGVFFGFLRNPQRCRHHAMTGGKYALAAVLCLQYLFQHPTFSGSIAKLTGANIHTRRNSPWRWQQLVATSCQFQARHRHSRILRGCDSWFCSWWPFPKCHRKHPPMKRKNPLYRDLLRCLPIILREADRSEAVLKFVDREFPDTSSKYMREKKAARIALNDYVARMFGQTSPNEDA